MLLWWLWTRYENSRKRRRETPDARGSPVITPLPARVEEPAENEVILVPETVPERSLVPVVPALPARAEEPDNQEEPMPEKAEETPIAKALREAKMDWPWTRRRDPPIRFWGDLYLTPLTGYTDEEVRTTAQYLGIPDEGKTADELRIEISQMAASHPPEEPVWVNAAAPPAFVGATRRRTDRLGPVRFGRRRTVAEPHDHADEETRMNNGWNFVGAFVLAVLAILFFVTPGWFWDLPGLDNPFDDDGSAMVTKATDRSDTDSAPAVTQLSDEDMEALKASFITAIDERLDETEGRVQDLLQDIRDDINSATAEELAQNRADWLQELEDLGVVVNAQSSNSNGANSPRATVVPTRAATVAPNPGSGNGGQFSIGCGDKNVGAVQELIGLSVVCLGTEYDAYTWRSVPLAVDGTCPEGWICTLHLAEGDKIIVTETSSKYSIVAGTFRRKTGYPGSDAVHNACALLTKEKVFGASQNPRFDVEPHGFSCNGNQKTATQPVAPAAVQQQSVQVQSAPAQVHAPVVQPVPQAPAQDVVEPNTCPSFDEAIAQVGGNGGDWAQIEINGFKFGPGAPLTTLTVPPGGRIDHAGGSATSGTVDADEATVWYLSCVG